jgi:hypothetical protein
MDGWVMFGRGRKCCLLLDNQPLHVLCPSTDLNAKGGWPTSHFSSRPSRCFNFFTYDCTICCSLLKFNAWQFSTPPCAHGSTLSGTCITPNCSRQSRWQLYPCDLRRSLAVGEGRVHTAGLQRRCRMIHLHHLGQRSQRRIGMAI